MHALYEGDRYESWDTVLTVEGPYEAFGYLETLCLGTLARRTRDLHEREADLRRGGVQAGDGLWRARRRVPHAAGRRLQRHGRRREGDVDGRAGVAVRRQDRGDDSARVDRALRRRHGEGDQTVRRDVRGRGADRARGLRERFGEDERGRGEGARGGASVGRATGHGRDDGRQVGGAADGRVQADRRERRRSCGTCATRSTPKGLAR